MPYEINNTSGNRTITVQDQTINDADTSLTFVGKNYPGYGQFIAENFYHILENFAATTAPTNPVAGQLWYDTANNSLMIFDSTTWVPSNSISKGTSQPRAERSNIGDLWVDTANQQLYLFTGSTWILVGPEFSQGSLTGVKVVELIDRATNTGKFVLIFYVNDSPVLIVSKFEFTPKTVVSGFETIKQGINLSSEDFDLDGEMLNKFWGTAEKSNSLVVGTRTVPAANFLRSDVVSTTNYTLNIRNGGGLVIGDSLETSLTTSSSGAILYHKNADSPIILRTTTTGGAAKDVITVTGEEQVGINKPNPTQALDVNGNILSNGRIRTTNTTESTSVSTGSLTAAGGAGITGRLNVGGNTAISGTLSSGALTVTGGAAITGSVSATSVSATTFTGSFVGGLTGTVNGSATRLANTANFSLRGDVVSNTLPFNGSKPVVDSNISAVSRAANVATITTVENHNFVSGYIVSIECSDTTFNTTGTGSVITVTGLKTFTYANTGSPISGSSATGTVSVNPGGVFNTTISENIIAERTEASSTLNSDYFLVYRASGIDSGETVPGPKLRKISKSTLFSTAGTVPTGSIMPFAGDTPPAGYLLCDGSEQSQSLYSELFSVIGYKFKPVGLLTGFQTFALPDLRGRFPLGRETMDNNNNVSKQVTGTSASRAAITTLGEISATFTVPTANITNGPFQTGRTLTGTGLDTSNGPAVIESISIVGSNTVIGVSMPPQDTTYPAVSGSITLTSIGTMDGGGGAPVPARVPAATDIGNVGGSRQHSLSLNQLPEHEHDMKGSAGNQFYGLNFNSGTPTDAGAITTSIHRTSNAAQLLPESGGVKTTGALGQPFDIINPYLTINYVIFTGRIS
jgi:microcystin-dependent protein